jgi:2-polyprenyl-6-hydroxyphenyl methylase/3-demethylubiquinone-9 3-methyltransferase
MSALARRVGLDTVELAGIGYNPLSRTFRLVRDTSVNYLVALRRRTDA